ncbi:MAG: hypothetical protein RLZZ598_1933, partial [Pseudomonadota bacterium]
MSLIEVKVPDIGDFESVAVIELLVKPGDSIKVEQSLITVESDKASMEIPSSHAGVVKELRVALGDQVRQGSVVLVLNVAEAATEPVAVPASASPPPAIATPIAVAAPAFAGAVEAEFDVLVLGAGPGGYSAAFRAADLGLKVALVERYPTLGGVCLNVGCIPSKALLHVAAVIDESSHLEALGVKFDKPSIDLDKLRAHKNKVVGKLTGGLAAMAKMRKVTVLTGEGSFADPQHLHVKAADGGAKTVKFKRAIIAAGSEAVKLPFLPSNDPRIVTSTGALELRQQPKRMLVIGGGIIGLEMGTVYSTLGARLDVVEMADSLMLGADRDLVKVWEKFNRQRFDHLMLKTKTIGAVAKAEGIEVSFEGEGAPAPQTYDLVLQAVGRTPNGHRIGAEAAGVAVSERGFIAVDRQMRTNVPNIFAIGDIVGQPMLAHKAVHEGHVAAEVIAGELKGDEQLARSAFDARVIPSVAYTDPEVAWVGLTEDEAKARGMKITKGLFPWAASGRAIANGRDEGFTKLIFDADSHRILGGAIVGTHAGDMIGEVALAIEMGADMVDI